MTYEQLQDTAELISLALTWPCVAGAVCVIMMWAKSAIAAMQKKRLAATDWFILGVAISFFGSMVDNVYWSIPWTASFVEHPATAALVNFGVFVNIPFRQVTGVLAAGCHIYAAVTSAKSKVAQRKRKLLLAVVMAIAILAGLLHSTALVFWR